LAVYRRVVVIGWRVIVGSLVVAALAGLCWLDHRASIAGVWLGPVVLVLAGLGTHELLGLYAAVDIRPGPLVVYGGVGVVVASNWLGRVIGPAPSGPWPVRPEGLAGAFAGPCLALALVLGAAFVGQMRRFERPGRSLVPLAATCFAFVYLGLLLSFAVQLRLVFGVAALVSLVLVVKLADTGAYFAGRLLGRHKLAPVLSPGKTWEGVAGALVFALVGAWLSFAWLVPVMNTQAEACGMASPWWGWIAYAGVLAVMGILGDLAESLLKREAGRKDSSTWLPGLGGVLDMLDSILLAAPAAYLFWALGLVGLG